MPVYQFTCLNNHITEEFRPVKDYTDVILCSSCGLEATITISNNLYVRTFKPYVEENFNGKPIEIKSSKQRDALCKKFGVTYDSAKYMTRPKVKSAIDDVNYGMVKEAIESGKLPDGTPLEKPGLPNDQI